MKGNLFSFMARIRIPTVLRGHQYNYTETVPIRKANHHLFPNYSCERSNFPALDKIRSYSVTFVRERLQLLRWFFTWTRTYLVEKNCLYRVRNHKKYLLSRQRNTSQVHVPFWLFASNVNCDLGGQWAMDRFEEWLKVPQ